jgi:hypothetical protein
LIKVHESTVGGLQTSLAEARLALVEDRRRVELLSELKANLELTIQDLRARLSACEAALFDAKAVLERELKAKQEAREEGFKVAAEVGRSLAEEKASSAAIQERSAKAIAAAAAQAKAATDDLTAQLRQRDNELSILRATLSEVRSSQEMLSKESRSVSVERDELRRHATFWRSKAEEIRAAYATLKADSDARATLIVELLPKASISAEEQARIVASVTSAALTPSIPATLAPPGDMGGDLSLEELARGESDVGAGSILSPGEVARSGRTPGAQNKVATASPGASVGRYGRRAAPVSSSKAPSPPRGSQSGLENERSMLDDASASLQDDGSSVTTSPSRGNGGGGGDLLSPRSKRAVGSARDRIMNRIANPNPEPVAVPSSTVPAPVTEIHALLSSSGPALPPVAMATTSTSSSYQESSQKAPSNERRASTASVERAPAEAARAGLQASMRERAKKDSTKGR